MLVPKAAELVATPYRFEGDKRKAREFFESGMSKVFRRLYECASDKAPVTIYYAYKQSETEASENKSVSTGWETMLSAIIEAGFAVSGAWPMRTELSNRQIASGTNALASSIVLVCRKRPADAPAATRRQFITELKKSLPAAVRKMQAANIAPVDLAQAAIGPGMEIYSKYSRVLEADGSLMSVRRALQLINAELDNYFGAQEGRLDEESRFCVDLYSHFAFNDVKFGEADVLAKAKNTSVARLAQTGLLVAQKGVTRLLSREELPEKTADFSGLSDCLWLLAQYLVKALAEGGASAAGKLAAVYMAEAEAARDLAYRLFAIADRKGWSKEAFDYNALVVAWPEVMEAAARTQSRKITQGTLSS